MEALLFLLVAVALIGLGTSFVLLRAREPKGEYHAIKTFQKEMHALSPTPAEGIQRPAGVDPLLYERSRATPPDDAMDTRPAEHQE